MVLKLSMPGPPPPLPPPRHSYGQPGADQIQPCPYTTESHRFASPSRPHPLGRGAFNHSQSAAGFHLIKVSSPQPQARFARPPPAIGLEVSRTHRPSAPPRCAATPLGAAEEDELVGNREERKPETCARYGDEIHRDLGREGEA
jgi:hypothetical protein